MNGFKVKKIVTIVMVTLALLIGLDYGVSVYCYNNVFGKRLDTYEPTALKVSDFEGLNATHYEFASDKGQMLSGYLYGHTASEIGHRQLPQKYWPTTLFSPVHK